MVFNIIRTAAFENCLFQPCRYFRTRGKPPGVARSLKERMDEMNYKDEIYSKKTDIGLPFIKPNAKKIRADRIKYINEQKNNIELAQLARKHELMVDLALVRQDWTKSSEGGMHVKRIAEHYGVFEHLYGEGYFIPSIALSVHFEQDDSSLCPVYYGNIVKPSEATVAPLVSFESDDKSFYSLVLTSLDGHFTYKSKEYLHWFIANIPGNDIEKGQTLVKYLQPIPVRGTGYHRYVFVLYKQTKPLEFSIPPGDTLNDRTFETRNWYAQHQDDITPAGLAFFQSDWDYSLQDFFHNKLQMAEPIFEYDFPKPYIKKQKWYPLKQAFDVYMDRYRDPKQINKEYLERVLRNEHPFKKSLPKLKFPNAQPLPRNMPSWLRTKEERFRLGLGRVNNIEEL